MNKISAFLLVLLLFSILAATANSGVSAEVTNVKILSYNYYFDSAGYLDIVGEVQNVGSETVANVTLFSSVEGSTGLSIQQYDIALARYILPGEKSPFYIEIHSYTGTYGTWDGGDVTEATVTVKDAPTVRQYRYQDISITEKKAANVDGVFWANGTVTNTGSQTAKVISVLGTFYNSDGKVVAVGYTDAISTLAPGASAKFIAWAFDQNQTLMPQDRKVTAYQLMIELNSPILTGASPTSYPTDSANTSNPIETVPPNDVYNQDDQSTQSVIIVVAAALVVAIVLASVLLIKRRKQ